MMRPDVLDTEKPLDSKPPVTMMAGNTPQVVAPAPLSFEGWCNRLHPAPRVVQGASVAAAEDRTTRSSTDVRSRFIPETIDFWPDFLPYVAAWKRHMLDCGLGVQQRFDYYAGGTTRNYASGWINPTVVRSEPTSRISLHGYFQMVNEFNIDFHQFLHPTRPHVNPAVEIYKEITAEAGVASNADLMISCGTDYQRTVGLGEVKAPWVVTRTAIQRLMIDLPFVNFGRQFVARAAPSDDSTDQVKEEYRQHVLMGKAITQLYNDMITDGVTVGFLATTERIIYCFIPPSNRKHLSLYVNECYRQETGWGHYTPEARRFTPQVGLATLAWIGRRFYPDLQFKPDDLKRYSHYWSKKGKNEHDLDPTYRQRSSKSSARGTANSRQHRPIQGGYQYCTLLCLRALLIGDYHPQCPNAECHQITKFDLDGVIDDLLECMDANEREIIGGGNSATCVAVRSLKYGHLVVVKVFHEATEQELSDNEAKVYEHLSHLQGEYIPLILAKVSAIFAGTYRRMLFMSYGGIPLSRCVANDELVDQLAKACIALRANGILLDDSSPENVLANDKEIAVIDFETAYIVDPPSPAVLERYKSNVDSIATKIKTEGWPLTDLCPDY